MLPPQPLSSSSSWVLACSGSRTLSNRHKIVKPLWCLRHPSCHHPPPRVNLLSQQLQTAPSPQRLTLEAPSPQRLTLEAPSPQRLTLKALSPSGRIVSRPLSAVQAPIKRRHPASIPSPQKRRPRFPQPHPTRHQKCHHIRKKSNCCALLTTIKGTTKEGSANWGFLHPTHCRRSTAGLPKGAPAAS